MLISGDGKMKKLAMMVMILVFGLSGCACTGTCVLIKEDWDHYWNEPGAGSWDSLKQEWVDFWD